MFTEWILRKGLAVGLFAVESLFLFAGKHAFGLANDFASSSEILASNGSNGLLRQLPFFLSFDRLSSFQVSTLRFCNHLHNDVMSRRTGVPGFAKQAGMADIGHIIVRRSNLDGARGEVANAANAEALAGVVEGNMKDRAMGGGISEMRIDGNRLLQFESLARRPAREEREECCAQSKQLKT